MNYNRIILAGRLTRDPELSYTPSQTAIASFAIAVNRRMKERQDVLFIECKVFGKSAETVKTFFSKGRSILVDGRLALDTWESKTGEKRQKFYVNVESFTFTDDGKAPEKENTQPSESTDEEIPF